VIFKKSFSVANVATAKVLAGLTATAGAPAAAQDAAKAQAGAPLNIRVVDVDGIRSQSKAFIAARDQIAAYGKAQNQALQTQDKALREANAELNRKRTIITPQVFPEERKNFEQSATAFKRKTQQQQKAMNKLQLDVMSQLNKKIIKIITEYAEANNVTLSLPIQSVLLRDDSLGMDAHVLERLNKELPSMTVALPTK